MARVAGITIEKDMQGNARFARIDLRKYGNLLNPFFKEIGMDAEISTYDKKFVAKIKESENQPGISIKIEDLWK